MEFDVHYLLRQEHCEYDESDHCEEKSEKKELNKHNCLPL